MNIYRIWCIPPDDDGVVYVFSSGYISPHRPVLSWRNWVMLPRIAERNIYEEMSLVTVHRGYTSTNKEYALNTVAHLKRYHPTYSFTIVKFTETMHKVYKTNRRKKHRIVNTERRLDPDL